MRVSTRSGSDRTRHLVVIGGHAALDRGALHRARQRSAQGGGATASWRRVADGGGAAAYEAKDV
eukprot:4285276-Pleurochrysis_carterae.AAC.1